MAKQNSFMRELFVFILLALFKIIQMFISPDLFSSEVDILHFGIIFIFTLMPVLFWNLIEKYNYKDYFISKLITHTLILFIMFGALLVIFNYNVSFLDDTVRFWGYSFVPAILIGAILPRNGTLNKIVK
jgi:hypothetical protein